MFFKLELNGKLNVVYLLFCKDKKLKVAKKGNFIFAIPSDTIRRSGRYRPRTRKWRSHLRCRLAGEKSVRAIASY